MWIFEHGGQPLTPQQFKKNSHAGDSSHNDQQRGLGSKFLSESKSQLWESVGSSGLSGQCYQVTPVPWHVPVQRRFCNSSIVNYSLSSLIAILKCGMDIIFFQPYEGFQMWLIGSESLAVLQINISDSWISESIFLIKLSKYFLNELPDIAVF